MGLFFKNLLAMLHMVYGILIPQERIQPKSHRVLTTGLPEKSLWWALNVLLRGKE